MGTLEKTQTEICTATAFLGIVGIPSIFLGLIQIILVKWSLALLPAFNWHLAWQSCFGAVLCKKKK